MHRRWWVASKFPTDILECEVYSTIWKMKLFFIFCLRFVLGYLDMFVRGYLDIIGSVASSAMISSGRPLWRPDCIRGSTVGSDDACITDHGVERNVPIGNR